MHNNQEIGLLYFARLINDPLMSSEFAAETFKSWQIPIVLPKIIKDKEQQYEEFNEPITSHGLKILIHKVYLIIR